MVSHRVSFGLLGGLITAFFGGMSKTGAIRLRPEAPSTTGVDDVSRKMRVGCARSPTRCCQLAER
jgi:hypothetical protein